MTISRHNSLALIAPGRSSAQHPASVQSYMFVFAGRPTLACSCDGFHRRTSLMSSSLLLQQCPACLVRLTQMGCVKWGRWPYSCVLVGCCFHVLFNIACSIFVQVPSSLFSRRFVKVQVVQPYSNTETSTAWKNFCFNLSARSDFHITDNLPLGKVLSFSILPVLGISSSSTVLLQIWLSH